MNLELFMKFLDHALRVVQCSQPPPAPFHKGPEMKNNKLNGDYQINVIHVRAGWAGHNVAANLLEERIAVMFM